MEKVSLKIFIFLMLLLGASPVLSQVIDQATVLKTIPAIAEALAKKAGVTEEKEEAKKIKHPKLVNKYKTNDCVKVVCEKLGSFGCDTEGELEQVKQSCHDFKAMGCLNFTCNKLGSFGCCLLYTSPSPRDRTRSRMPSSA